MNYLFKMNTEQVARTEFCHSCLNFGENWHLHNYDFNDQHIKSLIQVPQVTLCYLCRTVAKKTEAFISNVQNTQMKLYSAELINTSSLKYMQNEYKNIVNLTQTSYNPVETVMKDDKSEDKSVIDAPTVENILIETPISDESKVEICSCQNDQVLVKLEMKFEEDMGLDDGIDDHDDVTDSFEPMKDEELSDILKLELEADEIDLKTLKKTLKKLPKRKSKTRQCKLNSNLEELKKRLKDKKKVKKEDSKKAKSIVINQDDEAIPIDLITLTEEQCQAERSKMQRDRKYIAYAYKCEDCIKGFNYKESYTKHMEEKHDQKNSKHTCRICKQCLTSNQKREQHMNVHFRRHRCVECGFTTVMRRTMVQHYLSRHAPENKLFHCPHCSKTYKLRHQMKKHVYYAHGATRRVECNFCKKSYASKDVLKWHLRIIHPEHTDPIPFKLYPCGECGAKFRAPSLLKKHGLKHTEDKAHYCVECDKSFKSDTSLKKHLKTVSPHVSNTELPFPCPHCEKRFGVKRDVVRHVNSVHLNNRPFQCDKCEKGYVSKWSLTEHMQLAHEGYKRPLRFPCHFCHKVFDRMQILKAHIRTHTGERPYQCSECSSQFSQLSVMKTHVNLVHLKLTRDGKPKGVS